MRGGEAVEALGQDASSTALISFFIRCSPVLIRPARRCRDRSASGRRYVARISCSSDRDRAFFSGSSRSGRRSSRCRYVVRADGRARRPGWARSICGEKRVALAHGEMAHREDGLEILRRDRRRDRPGWTMRDEAAVLAQRFGQAPPDAGRPVLEPARRIACRPRPRCRLRSALPWKAIPQPSTKPRSRP